MAFAPLILRGNLTIDGESVADQVTSFQFKGMRDQIEIPATFGQRKSVAGGGDSYEAEISFLQDIDAEAISQIFWNALADADGTVELAGTLKAGSVSATNPEFTVTALVTAANLGGEVNTVGVDSVTLPCLDRPVKTTT